MNTALLALFSLWPGKTLNPADSATAGYIVLTIYVALLVVGHLVHKHEMKKAEK